MSKKKKNRISVFLIKEGITNHADILEGHDLLNFKVINGTTTTGGTLYFPESHDYPPDWVKGFFDNLELDVRFMNSNTRAVYLMETAGRIFALVFGYGKSMIQKGTYEDDFGLYTTLNLVLPDTLKSIDKVDLSLSGKKSKENLTKSGSITDFGVDVEQDLLNEVTGKSKVPELGNIITGRESFHSKVEATHEDISSVLENLLVYYKKTDYKTDFEWVDNVKGVIDEKLIEALEEKLIEKIKNSDHEKIWLAVPEVIIWSDIEGFKYGKSVPKTNEVYDDLFLDDFKTIFSEELPTLTIDILKKNLHVFCGYDFTGKKFDKWSIFECLYAEIEYDENCFALSNGRWYKVKDNFVADIDQKFNSIPTVDIGLPAYDEARYKGKGKNKGETGYNSDVASTDTGYVLFDTKSIDIGGGKNKIEYCDLYKKQTKQLIHIKRYGGSNVFSHLFNQGLVSGESFLGERLFREKVNAIMPDDSKFSNLNLTPKSSDYEIVFAVISSMASDLSLPFFSKVSLSNVYKRLKTLGFKVAKSKISKI